MSGQLPVAIAVIDGRGFDFDEAIRFVGNLEQPRGVRGAGPSAPPLREDSAPAPRLAEIRGRSGGDQGASPGADRGWRRCDGDHSEVRERVYACGAR